jgi:hypothetical protein
VRQTGDRTTLPYFTQAAMSFQQPRPLYLIPIKLSLINSNRGVVIIYAATALPFLSGISTLEPTTGLNSEGHIVVAHVGNAQPWRGLRLQD